LGHNIPDTFPIVKRNDEKTQRIRRMGALFSEDGFKDIGRVRDVVSGPDGSLYVAFNEPARVARLVFMRSTGTTARTRFTPARVPDESPRTPPGHRTLPLVKGP
jgi:hypothetical protein